MSIRMIQRSFRLLTFLAAVLAGTQGADAA
jgi:hypothetical protein